MTYAYRRVSTSKQVLANQQNEIERFAESKSITVDKWVTEVISGRKKQSERKLGRLLSKLKKGDTLIVSEVSRLSRSLTDIMSIMGKCIDKGVILYCVKEGYTFDDSINSKVLCFAFGLVAEIERNLISMRTKEALAMRKAEGVKLGRRYGSAPKMNILRQSKNEIIEKINQNYSINKICKYYNVSRDTFMIFMRNDDAIRAAITSQRNKKKCFSFEYNLFLIYLPPKLLD